MKRHSMAALVAFGLTTVACAAEHTTDGLDAVKKSVAAKKAVLVDVREASEWKDGHLKDANHLALSELKAGADAEKVKTELPAGSIVYLHCGSGKRCLVAADILKKQGYDVRPLKEGFADLVKNGFPADK